MDSPILISIASIIPGLGLWLLGERRQAINAAILVLGSLFVALLSPWETISIVSQFIFIILWILQGVHACYDARLQKLIKKGAIQLARTDTHFPPYPRGMSRWEKAALRAKKIIGQQLTSSEYVKEAVFANQTSFFRGVCSYQNFYVGLSKDELIVVNTFFHGKPAGVVRIRLDSVIKLKIKHGLLYDHLHLSLDEKGKGYNFRITRGQRKHTNKLVAEIAKQMP